MPDALAAQRYRAFISYSHKDAGWSRWLHRALESYRLPSALVGRTTSAGPIPARLGPIFRDREELASSHDLSGRILDALAASSHLIVICSPNSAKSRWVNEEIKSFQRLGRAERILCLIIDGEPGSGDERECFPPALRALKRDTPDGPKCAEPIAADIRSEGDGRGNAKLKLIAGLVGVNLDALKQREARRRQRQLLGITAASVAGMIFTVALSLIALKARHEAERQQAQAEGLVEFMLGDLRKKLEPVGRLDVMEVVGEEALAFYAQQRLTELDANSLGRRSRALHLIGEIDFRRGDLHAASKAFQEAAATTEEQLARNPEEPQRLFDHAQSVFWIGYVAMEQGFLDEAKPSFDAYLRMADTLTATQPDEPAWKLEKAYAHNNLGALALRQSDPKTAMAHFEATVAVRRALVQEEPSTARREQLARALVWLADSQLQAGNLGSATQTLSEQDQLYASLRRAEPANARYMAEHGNALAWMARAQKLSGRTQDSRDALQGAMSLSQSLLALDPNDISYRFLAVQVLSSMAELALLTSNLADATRFVGHAQALVAEADLSELPKWRRTLAWLRLRQAELQAAQGMPRQALQSVSAVLDPIHDKKITDPSSDQRLLLAMAYLLKGDQLLALGEPQLAQDAWRDGLEGSDAEQAHAVEPLEIADLRSLLFERLGDEGRSRSHQQHLQQYGYVSLRRLSSSRPAEAPSGDAGSTGAANTHVAYF